MERQNLEGDHASHARGFLAIIIGRMLSKVHGVVSWVNANSVGDQIPARLSQKVFSSMSNPAGVSRLDFGLNISVIISKLHCNLTVQYQHTQQGATISACNMPDE